MTRSASHPRAVLGVDIGGTRISVGVVDSGGRLLCLLREPTPRRLGAEATLERLYAMAQDAIACAEAESAVRAIGIGFGGPVDSAQGVIRRSHHARGWSGIALGRLFGERFGLPVVLENDANAGGLGEALFGAGRGARSVLYVNVGTGIGGALILDGHIERGANSNAGEIGHCVVRPDDGPICTCGKRGCIEALASGDAIGRAARERLAAERHRPSSLRGLGAREVTGRAVGEAAIAGDPLATDVVTEAARWLGLGIAFAANLVDPALIVIGGGVPEMGEVFMAPLGVAFSAFATPPVADNTRIAPAELGYDAGVIGAAAAALAARPPVA